ncbi:MAG: hypothetical protein ACYC6R_08890 [Anaerolineales bacterium]
MIKKTCIKPRAEGAFRFLKHKNGQAKLTHGTGKYGNNLSYPNKGKANHAARAFCGSFFRV